MSDNSIHKNKEVPNDHGHFGEKAAEGKYPVDENKEPHAKKTSETEGLNEAKSKGDAGAFEGLENAGE